MDEINGQSLEIEDKLNTINLANETSVLMTVLCQKLGLEPKKTTQTTFLQAFSKLQSDSLDAQKYMQEKYMLANSTPVKERKTRLKKIG